MLTFLFLVTAGLAAYYGLNFLLHTEKPVVVPDLAEREVVYALEVLTELGLNTKVEGFVYHPEVPKNHVISQQPEPGQEIRRGRDVRILISKGEKQIPAPNVSRLDMYQAKIILEDNDLCSGVLAFTSDSGVARDKVMEQWPLPGAAIDRGTCVDLLVSTGLIGQRYKMPSLKGQSLFRATELLRSDGLKTGSVSFVNDEHDSGEGIVGQNPPAGHVLDASVAVDLQVKRGAVYGKGENSGDRSLVNVIQYQTAKGILRRHIQVLVSSRGFENEIYNDFVPAGSEVWLIVPYIEDAVVILYADDKLEMISSL